MKFEVEHPLREAAEAVKEINKKYSDKETERVNTVKKEREDWLEKLDQYRDQRELKDLEYFNFSEQVYDNLLGSALKGIYISALQENHALSERSLTIANENVDRYIRENGGAKSIMDNKMNNKTYLLNNIARCVAEAHDETIDKADRDDPETFVPDETSKEKMFDKLENDQDTDHAIEVIALRVGNAESDFIKKNADNKQKINDIVDKINSDIDDTKTDTNMTPDEKEKEISDAQTESSKIIDNIKHEGFDSIFNTMVTENAEFIIKDDKLKESYTDESGRINMSDIVESSMVMYGFLEFVNTIQLESVNSDYIKNIIENDL